jgi:hypothetical protein
MAQSMLSNFARAAVARRIGAPAAEFTMGIAKGQEGWAHPEHLSHLLYHSERRLTAPVLPLNNCRSCHASTPSQFALSKAALLTSRAKTHCKRFRSRVTALQPGPHDLAHAASLTPCCFRHFIWVRGAPNARRLLNYTNRAGAACFNSDCGLPFRLSDGPHEPSVCSMVRSHLHDDVLIRVCVRQTYSPPLLRIRRTSLFFSAAPSNFHHSHGV